MLWFLPENVLYIIRLNFVLGSLIVSHDLHSTSFSVSSVTFEQWRLILSEIRDDILPIFNDLLRSTMAVFVIFIRLCAMARNHSVSLVFLSSFVSQFFNGDNS